MDKDMDTSTLLGTIQRLLARFFYIIGDYIGTTEATLLGGLLRDYY